MKVNFKSVKVQMTFEGEAISIDLRKELGNAIRRNTADIGMDETARQIYFSDEEIEIPNEHANDIIAIASKSFIVPIQQALKELLTNKDKEE